MRTQDLYTTVRTEGGLLPVDLLQRIVSGNSLEGLEPTDYHLATGERLNEAISRSWTRLTTAWKNFRLATEKLPSTDPATSLTREKWLLILFDELHYGRLPAAKAIDLDGRSYPISHFWQNTPIHLVGFNIQLDKRTASIAGAARTSPHSLVQEFLNRSEPSMWGFVSNGGKLRILRDNKSLTRQAYVEFDLQGMMEAEVFSDFALLWLLCHQSRVEADRPENCWLQKWMQSAQQQGTRALDHLRQGVEQAIKLLGVGFLSHRANSNLQEKLRSGTLTTQDYYRQLLRLVYRLLFLFVAEDRDLLLGPKSDPSTRERFLRYYSTTRIRRLAQKRAGTKHSDLYWALLIVMEGLSSDTGSKELGLPPLGSFLWSPAAIPDLAVCEISNRDFLDAIRALAFTEDHGMLRAVDYKNLGSEELGSIYESLLELQPEVDSSGQVFELKVAPGHERKTTGSYYTPTSLIQCLLDSALDPILDEACKDKDPEKAILNLKVCDPACGSGHFLVAAAHRIAKRLASVCTGDEEPAPEAIRTSLRDVIGHCIYGVDINPMSVELCKVSLWMEALEPGKPLSFLEHHIQCGNSLIGSTPALLRKGIPDEAFTSIEGDDKSFCSKLKKRNKQERAGLQNLFDSYGEPWERLGDLAASITVLDEIDDDSIEGVKNKQERYQNLVHSAGYEFGRLWADAWCAAFVWKKSPDSGLPDAITEEVFREIEKSPFRITPQMREEIKRLGKQYRFFHWHLAFPDVFSLPAKDRPLENDQTGWNHGFDVVLGNPPWERIKIQEKEWFAERQPKIAGAANAAARRRMIQSLKTEDFSLYRAFIEDRRKADGETVLVRESGRYPLCGRGDVNTYSIFAELNRQLINTGGQLGCIVPSGIASDDTTKFFFQDIMEKKSLVSLHDFENREKIFPAIDSRIKFCLLTLAGPKRPAIHGAEFIFYAHRVSDLLDNDRRLILNADDIALLNPITRTCPVLRSRHELELLRRLHRQGVLIESHEWKGFYIRLVHMDDHADEIALERDLGEGYFTSFFDFIGKANHYSRIIEPKLVHHFDHRYGSFEEVSDHDANAGKAKLVTTSEHKDPSFTVKPRYWIKTSIFRKILIKYPPQRGWLLGYRDITNTTNERTCIATVIPETATTVSMPCIGVGETSMRPFLQANLSVFCFDFAVRTKVPGTHLMWGIFKQLPILTPAIYELQCPWSLEPLTLRDWLSPRVLELSYTAWDLQAFGLDCGWSGPPFRWNEERRLLLRCELDAAYFHLYLGSDDEWNKQPEALLSAFPTPRSSLDYVMETFPIVKRKDVEKYGDYRTKLLIQRCYDAMKEAIETGKPYQTILDPPAADPSVAHPMSSKRNAEI